MNLQSLIGSKVVSWGQEYDYHRLVLDRARLTLYNPVAGCGDIFVGCTVADVALEEGVEFRLGFDNGTQMRMSLLEEHYVGPEAGVVGFQDGTIGIIG